MMMKKINKPWRADQVGKEDERDKSWTMTRDEAICHLSYVLQETNSLIFSLLMHDEDHPLKVGEASKMKDKALELERSAARVTHDYFWGLVRAGSDKKEE